MDRSLDEILAERRTQRSGSRNQQRGGGGGNRRRGGQEYPRDGVRKSFRDETRNFDSEWVHDKFDDRGSPRLSANRRRRSPDVDVRSGTRVRVDNLHYELTEEDLEGLFNKIGPVQKLELRYDRAGRSEGQAFVTYESHQDAQKAVREYDGANAAGQPIRLTIMPSAPAVRRNPFDTAIMPGKSLAERITLPPGRSRSLSPSRGRIDDDVAGRGGDRYRPGGGNGSRSRSPLPPRRREGGRRPGARRDGGGGSGLSGPPGARGNDPGSRAGKDGRPKKTQQELDAEMEDYFGGPSGNGAQQTGASNVDGAASKQAAEDIDMIE